MLRNVVLAAFSLAVLCILFAAYWLAMEEPRGPATDDRPALESLPVPDTAAADPEERLRLGGGIEVPPGKGLEFTIFDPRTGRPLQRFKCSAWAPVAGSRQEITVQEPELDVRMPGGLRVSISAGAGHITVDRLRSLQGKPLVGTLSDQVRIEVASVGRDDGPETQPAPAEPAASRPARNVATITLDRLDFDLEVGELRADGALRITSPDFELSGSGLSLLWNQSTNVLERLELQQGDQLVLFGGARLFTAGGSAGDAAAESGAGQPAAAEPTETRPARGANSYTCVLAGDVVAEQYRGDEVLGRLTADEIRLLFDLGGAANRFMRRTTSAPAAEVDPQLRERLAVSWTGPLRLEPGPPATGDRPRRHFEARGEPVTLTHADGVGRCGRLEYRDETQQIWLQPTADGSVEFSLGGNVSASAESIYIDQANNIVKLIGDVSLLSRRGPGTGGKPQSVRCSTWAELKLAPAPQTEVAPPAPEAAASQPLGRQLLGTGQLESATFVGAAQVDLRGPVLSANRIDAKFRPTRPDEPSDAALESAVANGSVQLTAKDEALECERLDLAFGLTPAGALYPRRMDARGFVLIARERAWLAGDQVSADLEPAAETAGGGPAFVLRTLEIMGDAELRDPRNHVAARGQQISARFVGASRLSSGVVRGTPERFGLVHKAPYTVAGEQIALEREALILHVDGPARVSFQSSRSLQGEQRAAEVPIAVSCREKLHIDGQHNTIEFAGEVVARSGDEQLKADTLTLLLEDAAPPAPAAPAAPPDLRVAAVSAALAQIRQLRAPGAATRPEEGLALGLDEGERVRKEPVRIIAAQALVQTEQPDSAGGPPAVHSSIEAPELEVDLPGREIITRGRTTLLVTSRRLEDSGAPERDLLGLPSNLVARGPSQTAMEAQGGMRYVLGQPGPDRQDSVVFEGGVLFVHRAGRDVLNLDQMLPQGRADPALLSSLRSRNTYLQCARLECGFKAAGPPRGDQPGSLAGGLQLAWLLGAGDAYLRDVQGPTIREVYARQMDFDRTAGVIRVLGAPQVPARIYEENTEKGTTLPLSGEEFVIDLINNTVRAGGVRGGFRE